MSVNYPDPASTLSGGNQDCILTVELEVTTTKKSGRPSSSINIIDDQPPSYSAIFLINKDVKALTSNNYRVQATILVLLGL